MYIPSKEIQILLTSEHNAVLAETFGNNDSAALIIKAKSSSLKAIVNGCKLELFIGLCLDLNGKNYLSIAVKIYDSADTPILILGAIRLDIEKDGIFSICNNREFVITLYDEMDSNVCTARGKVGEIFAQEFLSLASQFNDFHLINSQKLLITFWIHSVLQLILHTEYMKNTSLPFFHVRLKFQM